MTVNLTVKLARLEGTDLWNLSRWIDNKPVQGEEEDHGRLLRHRGGHEGERRTGVYEADRLNYEGGRRE